MKNIFKIGTAFIVAMLLSACNPFIGERAVIAPTELGMVLEKDGFTGEMIGPSRFRLDTCWFICPELIKLDASDNRKQERVSVYMPDDDVFITVPVNLVLRLDRSRVNSIFGTVPHRGGYISLDDIYSRYAEENVIKTIRAFMSSDSIENFLANQEKKTEEFIELLSTSLEDTPFSLVNAGVREIGLPSEIESALKDAAERRIKVRQENEQLQVDLARLTRELEESRKQREVDVEKANAEKQIQQIIAEGYSEGYERYRMLEIMEMMAQSENKVFFPVDMIGSMALDMEMAKD